MAAAYAPGMPDTPDVFSPAKLGPITLRNRIIKSATFEAATPDALVSDELIRYHQLPAAQKALEALPDYARRAVVCRAYFLGGKAVVRLRGVEARLSCARS